MEAYNITNQEMIELKQTMGFRITDVLWNEFVSSHPKGCTSDEMIKFVKEKMDPPYKVDGSLDEYLERILRSFVTFVRG